MNSIKPDYRPFFYPIIIALPLLFFVLLEATLRIYDYDPVIPLFSPAAEGYEDYLTPNPAVALRYFGKNDEPPAPRNDYFLKQKPDSTLRIFLLGGSTAVGWPYGENMMPSRLLAAKLNAAFPEQPIEVINVAFSAINTYTLLDFVDEILAQSPDMVLIYSGHNEFYGALGIGSSKSVGQNRWLINRYLRLQQSSTFRLLNNLLNSITGAESSEEKPTSATKTLMQRMVQEADIPYGGTIYQAGVAQFRGNLQDLVEQFSAAGVEVVLSELVSNLRNQPPFVSHDGEASAANVYASAQQLAQQGHYVEARDAYRRAKDLDGLRFRAPEQFNQVIHQVAAHYGVAVVPMQRYFEQASPQQIIGSTLMIEHLHPNSDGYFLFSEAFYDTLQQHRLLQGSWPTTTNHQAFRQSWPLTEYDHVMAGLRIKYLMDHWPFQSWQQSGKVMADYQPTSDLEELAIQVISGMTYPMDARRMLAADYESQGDIDRAIAEYQALLAMYPYDVDLYREAAWMALKHQQLTEAEAILLRSLNVRPIAGAHKWLGQIYLRQTAYTDAIDHFEQALALSTSSDPQLTSLLGQAYVHAGQPDKAQDIYQRLPQTESTAPAP
ncbi:hypothetical protein MNBD_GAMMA18-1580 [hydrothermal vent metagenome]|uniref:SGNH hydrolase-type esterase domain-containing protein n=1 Tax=hydrothermal vent metagenome TaxID=652676 RepID=A0A3B0YTQ0_9ZZZZ